MEKQFFAGANTPDGFFSYFKYILSPEKANRIYILKGGSGVGKSTAIEKVAKHVRQKGVTVEYIRCSADKNSYDGICIPQLKAALIDGTAPHMIDPALPGASEVIVNLGDYLDNAALSGKKAEIAELGAQKSRLYKAAYAYMKSASYILELNNEMYEGLLDGYALAKLSETTAQGIFKEDYGRMGSVRKLFAEAFTSEGFVDYSDSLTDGKLVFCMDADFPVYAAKLLEGVAQYAVNRGYDLECYYDTMAPGKIRHILIPELDAVILGKTLPGGYASDIELSSVINAEKHSATKDAIEKNNRLFNVTMGYASEQLSKTKEQHNRLEGIYSSAMDFAKADAVVARICTELSDLSGK